MQLGTGPGCVAAPLSVSQARIQTVHTANHIAGLGGCRVGGAPRASATRLFVYDYCIYMVSVMYGRRCIVFLVLGLAWGRVLPQVHGLPPGQRAHVVISGIPSVPSKSKPRLPPSQRSRKWCQWPNPHRIRPQIPPRAQRNPTGRVHILDRRGICAVVRQNRISPKQRSCKS